MNNFWIALKNFFKDNINWCVGTLSDGREKPFNPLVWLYYLTLWPIPWQEDPCWCCASVRGYVQGFVLGVLAMFLWGFYCG